MVAANRATFTECGRNRFTLTHGELRLCSLRRPYRCMLTFIQTENHMAKAVARRTKGAVTAAGRRVRGGRAGWVRKNVAMDQRKLDVARRALGVETETEAIDQALDFVAFREELARGFTAIRRSGGVDDVLEGRRRA